jgi:hypothetical protein
VRARFKLWVAFPLNASNQTKLISDLGSHFAAATALPFPFDSINFEKNLLSNVAYNNLGIGYRNFLIKRLKYKISSFV